LVDGLLGLYEPTQVWATAVGDGCPNLRPGYPKRKIPDVFALRWKDDELANIGNWLKVIPCPSTQEDVALLHSHLNHYCSDKTIPEAIRILDTLGSSTFSEVKLVEYSVFPSIDINVLEFATAVFAIMLWAPIMQGSCVCIGADNTAT